MTTRRASAGRGVAKGLAISFGIPPHLAEAAGDPAAGAMMALKQAYESGDGGLRGQHLIQAQRHIASLDPRRHAVLINHLHGCAMELQGRGHDTRIAHVTPGEWVIPHGLQTPRMRAILEDEARRLGYDPSRLRVGSGRNSINPRTGQMEFDDFSNLADSESNNFFGNSDFPDGQGNLDPSALGDLPDSSNGAPMPPDFGATSPDPSSVPLVPSNLDPGSAAASGLVPINSNLSGNRYYDENGNPVDGMRVTAGNNQKSSNSNNADNSCGDIQTAIAAYNNGAAMSRNGGYLAATGVLSQLVPGLDIPGAAAGVVGAGAMGAGFLQQLGAGGYLYANGYPTPLYNDIVGKIMEPLIPPGTDIPDSTLNQTYKFFGIPTGQNPCPE